MKQSLHYCSSLKLQAQGLGFRATVAWNLVEIMSNDRTPEGTPGVRGDKE